MAGPLSFLYDNIDRLKKATKDVLKRSSLVKDKPKKDHLTLSPLAKFNQSPEIIASTHGKTRKQTDAVTDRLSEAEKKEIDKNAKLDFTWR